MCVICEGVTTAAFRLTLGEDDRGVSGLEAILNEPIEAVPHPHRTPDATVDLLLFDVFVKASRASLKLLQISLLCHEGKGLGWVDGASGSSMRFGS